MVDWMVSWGTPLFVTYDELHSPNHSSFHILMFTTRGQSEPQQYIQSPSFTMTEGTAAWKAIRQTRRHLQFENGASSNVSNQNLIIDSTTEGEGGLEKAEWDLNN